MKRYFLLIFCISSFLCFSQVQKEVDNGIFVSFPNSPTYKAVQNATTFSSKTENSIMMVIVQRNFVPDYPNFLIAQKKWTAIERKKIADTFLDNVVKGKLDYTGNTANVSEIKLGNFFGRKLSYSAINPTNGERSERYSIILLVRDKILNFECWELNKNSNFVNEKNNFLNSIKTK